MDIKVPRRDFLKTAQAAAGVLAYVPSAASAASQPAAVKIGGNYTPVPDYPIQPKRYSEVTIKDTFWQPKIKTNAELIQSFGVNSLNELTTVSRTTTTGAEPGTGTHSA